MEEKRFLQFLLALGLLMVAAFSVFLKKKGKAGLALSVLLLLPLVVTIYYLAFNNRTEIPHTQAAADTCYWVGDTNPAVWNDANHWANATGGTAGTCDGGTVPGADDTAIFDGANTNSATVDIAVSLVALNISAGYTGTVTLSPTAGQNLTLTGDLTLAQGTFDANGRDVACVNVTASGALTRTLDYGEGTWTVSGNWDSSGTNQTLTYGTSTVDLTGTGNVDTGKFYNLTCARNGQTTTLVTANSNVYNILSVYSGGTLAGAVTIVLRKNNGDPIVDTGATISVNVYYDPTTSITVTGHNFTGNVSYLSEVNDVTFTLSSDITGSSNISVDGFAAGRITTLNTSSYNVSCNNLTVNGNATSNYKGKIIFGSGTHTISGNLLKSGAAVDNTIDFGTGSISVGGNIDFTGIVVTVGTGAQTVTMNAGDTGNTITSAGAHFNNLAFNNAAGGWSFSDAALVDGNFTVVTSETAGNGVNLNNQTIGITGNARMDAGKLTAGSSAITVGGRWTVNGGTFVAGTSTVTMNAAAPSLDFDGNNDYVTLGDTTELNSVANFTISTWVKQDVVPSTDYLFLKNIDTSNRIFISFSVNRTMTVTVANATPTAGFIGTYDSYITAGRWHHIAIVYDGAGATNVNKLKLYIDGTYIAFDSFSGTIPATTANLSGADATIGYNNASFDGPIQDFRIYNASLSAPNVTTLYQTGAYTTNMVHRYKLTEGSGIVANDTGSNVMNGTISGATWGYGGKTVKSNGQNFNNITFNGTGGVWTLQDNLTATTLTSTLGTLVDNGKTVTVNGNISIVSTSTLTSTGIWIQGATGSLGNSINNGFNSFQIGNSVTSTLSRDTYTKTKLTLGTNALLVIGNSEFRIGYNSVTSNDFVDQGAGSNITTGSIGNLRIYINADANVTQKALNISARVNISPGTGSGLRGKITLTGNWTSGTLSLISGQTAAIESDAFVLDTSTFNLTVNGDLQLSDEWTGQKRNTILFSSGTHSVSGNITTNTTFAGTQNYLNFGSANISIGGNINFTQTTVTPGTSTVTMNAGDTGNTITSAGAHFNNLAFNNAAGGWSFSDAALVDGNFLVTTSETAGNGINLNSQTIGVTGNFTISAGKVTAGSSTITVAGNWDSSGGGTFTYNTSTVNLTGTGSVDTPVYDWSASRFYNLSMAAATKTTTLAESFGVLNDLTLGTGSLTGAYSVGLRKATGVVPLSNAGATITISQFVYFSSNTVVAGGNYGSTSVMVYGNGASTVNLGGDLTTTGTLIISGTGTFNTQNYAVNVLGVDIGGGGAAGTITSNLGSSIVTIGSGGLYIANNGGSHPLNLESATIYDAGQWKNVAGTGTLTVNPGTSTITFNGTTTLTSASQTFNNVQIGTASTGGSLSTADAAHIDGSLTALNGGATTLNISDDTVTLSSTVNLTNLDTFTTTASTVIFDGTTVLTSASQTFNNVQIGTASAGGSLTLSDTADFNGDLTVLNGGATTLNITSRTLNFGGDNFTLTNLDTFTVTSSTVVFDRAADSVSIVSSGLDFNNIEFNDAAGTATFMPTDAIDINGTFTLTDGILDLDTNDPTVNIAGNTTINGGSVTKGSGTVTFDGDLSYDDNVGSINFGNIAIGTSPDTTTLESNFVCDSLIVNSGDILTTQGYDIDCGGNITVAGTLNATHDDAKGGAASVNVAGNWNSTGGTFTGDTSTVTFDAADTGNTITSDGETFNNLTFNNSAGGWAFQDIVSVSGNLTISNCATSGNGVDLNGQNASVAGNFQINDGKFTTGSATIEVSGNWTNNGGTVNATGSTVTLGGSEAQNVTSNSQEFNNLKITNSNQSSGVSFLDSVTVTGTFTDTTAGSKLTFNAGSTYTFASIIIAGASGNNITLVSSASGTAWLLNVSAASPSVSYVTVSDSNASGGSTINATNNCTAGTGNTNWYFTGPVNESLTFTNYYSGTTNTAVADDTTEWNLRAMVSDSDGVNSINYIELRLANTNDSSAPYDSLKFRWTRATDAFSETADTLDTATLTSTSANSASSGNEWTLDFKVKLNNNFLSKSTNYAAGLYSVDTVGQTASNNYSGFYQVESSSLSISVDSSSLNFGDLRPGNPLTASAVATVNTNNSGGYILYIQDNIAGTGSAMTKSDGARIADFSSLISGPSLWSGTGLGLCVFNGTGKNAKWGDGTSVGDSNNKYAGIPETATEIHTKTGVPTVNNTTSLGFKLDVPLTQSTGAYSGSVTITVLAGL